MFHSKLLIPTKIYIIHFCVWNATSEIKLKFVLLHIFDNLSVQQNNLEIWRLHVTYSHRS